MAGCSTLLGRGTSLGLSFHPQGCWEGEMRKWVGDGLEEWTQLGMMLPLPSWGTTVGLGALPAGTPLIPLRPDC